MWWWFGGGVVWYLWDINTTPGYTTLLCSALDCGHMYGIALYFKGTRVVVVVVVGLSDNNTAQGFTTLLCPGFWQYVWIALYCKGTLGGGGGGGVVWWWWDLVIVIPLQV